MRQLSAALVLATTVVALASGVSAQVPGRAGQNPEGLPPGPAGRGPAPDAGASPAEIQRLFEAYVAIQAQTALGLSDEQYPKFLARIRTLQDVRRRAENQRGRILQELRRIMQSSNSDENLIKPQLKALEDLELRAASEARAALEAVDQVLDVQQQAKFRLFEEQMERRKVELLLRARQANRPRQQQFQ